MEDEWASADVSILLIYFVFIIFILEKRNTQSKKKEKGDRKGKPTNQPNTQTLMLKG